MARGTAIDGGTTDGLGDEQRFDIGAFDAAGTAIDGGNGNNDGNNNRDIPPEPKRRGWPKGKPRGKRGPASASSHSVGELDLSALDGILLGAHEFLAALSDCPELLLNPDEATKLRVAAQNVMRHYPITANQKAIDYAALALCVGQVYGTRIYLIRHRLRAQGEVIPPQQGYDVHAVYGTATDIPATAAE